MLADCWDTRCVRTIRAEGSALLDALLEFCTRCPFVRAAVDPSQGSLGARPDGYGAPGPKTLSALLASGLQYASLSGAAPILLEPRGRTNSASNSHSSTSLQGNDEFAVETSIVHNAAAAASIG